MHTILGASGVIGIEVARELHRRGLPVRVVSRKPPVLHLQEESFSADLLDEQATREAVRGSSVVYLTAGLTYDVRIWKKQWPHIVRNVLSACRAEKARLVFFDNVYMYGPVEGWMTEKTPHRPQSEKGRIRAELTDLLMDSAKKGEVDVRIARAADFYGPGAQNGIPNVLIFQNLSQGKRPMWLASGAYKHSVTYTKDAACAVVELGLCDQLPNQQRVWHLPTDSNAMTAEEWAKKAAEALGVAPKKLQVLGPWMIRLAGLFQRPIKELSEMLYQYDRDYLFSSQSFEKEFGISPTSYEQGIRETAQSYK